MALLGAALVLPGHFAAAQSAPRRSTLSSPLSSPVYKQVLYVSQAVELTQAVSPAPQVRLGPLTSSKHSYGLRASVADVGAAAGISGLPRIPFGGTQTTSAALAMAKAWADANGPAYLRSISRYALPRGIGVAYFSFYQAVDIQSATATPRKKGVLWSGTVDLHGRALYGDPRIVDGDPIFVDVQYFPLTTGEGVLDNEGYQHAGKLLWRLLNRSLQPLPTPGQGANGFAVVNVNGAYDAPSGSDGDVGATACFIDKRHPQCTLGVPASVLDVAVLSDQVGAAGAFAFYAQAVQMEYDAGGIPVLSVRYDKREVNCSALKELVTVGKQVTLNGGLYYAESRGRFYDYVAMGRTQRRQTLAPTTYAREALLANLASINYDPLQTLLSPFTNPSLPSAYLLTNAAQSETRDFLARVESIAPVEDLRQALPPVGLLDDAVKSSPDSYVARWATPSGGGGGGGGGDPTPVQPYGEPAAPTVDYELGIGSYSTLTPNNNLGGGDGQVFTRTFSFNVADPASVPTFLLTYLAWDDHFQVLVNGRQAFHSHDRIGDMLALATTWEGRNCSGNYATVPRYGDQCQERDVNGSCTSWNVIGTDLEWRPNPYATLMTQVSSSAWVTVEPVRSCVANGDGNEVCSTYLDLVSSGGCFMTEQFADARVAANLDLRSFLVPGLNTLTLNLAVGGGGEGWIRVRASAAPAGCVAPVPVAPSNNPLDGKTVTVQGHSASTSDWESAYVLRGVGGTVTATALNASHPLCTLSGPGSSCNLGLVGGEPAQTAAERLIASGTGTDVGSNTWGQFGTVSWNSDGSFSVWHYAAYGTVAVSDSTSLPIHVASSGRFDKATLQGLPASATLRLAQYRAY